MKMNSTFKERITDFALMHFRPLPAIKCHIYINMNAMLLYKFKFKYAFFTHRTSARKFTYKQSAE